MCIRDRVEAQRAAANAAAVDSDGIGAGRTLGATGAEAAADAEAARAGRENFERQTARLREEAEIKRKERESKGFVKKKVFEYVRNSGWGEGRMASTVSFGPELGMKHTGIKGSSNAVMRN